jgi:1-acyl-sn-glycerol-3-phosphate acyltransferase
MALTVFDTPLIAPFFRICSIVTLRLTGWKTRGKLPQVDRFVMIAEPHTSNVDLPLMLAVAFVFRLKLHWIGKDSLFQGWSGPLMRWLGGLPITRTGGGNEVSRVADHFRGREKIALAIAPTGTRSKDRDWRTGFYWIAMEAEVPILLSFLDFGARQTGVGELFYPTGDADADIATMRKFYEGMEGKYPSPK